MRKAILRNIVRKTQNRQNTERKDFPCGGKHFEFPSVLCFDTIGWVTGL